MRSWGNCGRERRSEAADRYRFPAVARSPSASEAPSRPPALYVRIDCAILDAARGFCDPADFGPARGRGGDCLVSKAFDWRPTTHGSASASRLVRPLGCRLLGDGGLQRGSLVFGRVPVRSTARTRLIWSQLWSQALVFVWIHFITYRLQTLRARTACAGERRSLRRVADVSRRAEISTDLVDRPRRILWIWRTTV